MGHDDSFDHELTRTFIARECRVDCTNVSDTPTFSLSCREGRGVFEILFFDILNDLAKPPKAKLVSVPAQFEDKYLPHLNPDKTICYLDFDRHTLSPVDKVGYINTCVAAVKRQVHRWAKEIDDEDVAAEFCAHWQPDDLVFSLMGDEKSGVHSEYTWKIGDTELSEKVIAPKALNITQWSRRRHALTPTVELQDIGKLTKVLRFKLKDGLFIPFAQKWPLESFAEFFEWIEKVDANTARAIVNRLYYLEGTQSEVYMEFDHKEEHFGFTTGLSPNLKAILKGRNVGNKGGGRKPRNKASHKTYKYEGIARAIRATPPQKLKFTRSILHKGDDQFLYGRNTGMENLSNLKIAVIGCGTVGAFAGYAMTLSGAGSGKGGSLTFYDDDFLSTGNIGRHLLGLPYLSRNKANAMVCYLRCQGHAGDFHAKARKFEKRDTNRNFDIIVDVSGELDFGELLTTWIDQKVGKRPLLIHGWVDGYGQAARAIANTGEGDAGCIGCLRNYNATGKATGPRYKVFLDGKEPLDDQKFKMACSSTYMPFPVASSMSAATLIYRLAMQKGEGGTILQQEFTANIRKLSAVKLSKSKNCPICGS